MAINREEYGQTQSLAVVHLNPQNILKRTGFRFVDQKDQPDEKETKKESKGTS